MNTTSRKNFIATMLGATMATPLMAAATKNDDPIDNKAQMPSFTEVKNVLKCQIHGYLTKNCYYENDRYLRNEVTEDINWMIEPFKTNGILSEYKVICDETNNPKSVIDNNELRVKIGLKEKGKDTFTVLDCIVLLTGGTWKEVFDA